MSENAVTRIEPTESTALIQMIERAAGNPQVDLDKMERLLQMQERIVRANAEADFNQAMSAAQAEMTRVSTDATNPQTRSRYATYGQIDRALRPIYTKHGISLSFGTGDTPMTDHVRVICTVARGGFSRDYHIDMPNDGKGAKGGDVMTKTHAAGAAATYGMRYLLKMIFNVAIGEDDVDGNEPHTMITAQQAADLQALIEEVGAKKAAFLKYFKVDTLEQLHANAYSTAVEALESKRKKAAP